MLHEEKEKSSSWWFPRSSFFLYILDIFIQFETIMFKCFFYKIIKLAERIMKPIFDEESL